MMGLSGPGLGTARRMGLVPELKAAAYPDMGTHTYRDRRGRDILSVDYRQLLAEMDWITLRRTQLVHVLHNAVRDHATIRMSTTVDSLQYGPSGGPLTAHLSDGSTCQADLLIAADGIHSSLRAQHIAPAADCLRPLGYRYAAYDIPETWHLAEDFVSYAEPGLQSEYYSLDAQRTAALHVWRSPVHGAVPAHERRALLAQVTAQSHMVVRSGLAAVEAGTDLVIDDLALVVLPAWHRGRVLLVGDAAHSLSLISGQGAGMALASAGVLAQELERSAGAGHVPTAEQLEQALQMHRRRLHPTIQRLQQRSRKIAPAFVPATPLSFYLRNLALRVMPGPVMRHVFLSGLKSEAQAMAALQ
jgi:2-polyprenyl-6-methoxyphenol hydroxylase-like FAD-dependent oxidoreductase